MVSLQKPAERHYIRMNDSLIYELTNSTIGLHRHIPGIDDVPDDIR